MEDLGEEEQDLFGGDATAHRVLQRRVLQFVDVLFLEDQRGSRSRLMVDDFEVSRHWIVQLYEVVILRPQPLLLCWPVG